MVTKRQAQAFLSTLYYDDFASGYPPRSRTHLEAVLGKFGVPEHPFHKTADEITKARNFATYLREVADAIERYGDE